MANCLARVGSETAESGYAKVATGLYLLAGNAGQFGTDPRRISFYTRISWAVEQIATGYEAGISWDGFQGGLLASRMGDCQNAVGERGACFVLRGKFGEFSA